MGMKQEVRGHAENHISSGVVGRVLEVVTTMLLGSDLRCSFIA